MRELAKHPGAIPSLIRFGRNSRDAAKARGVSGSICGRFLKARYLRQWKVGGVSEMSANQINEPNQQ